MGLLRSSEDRDARARFEEERRVRDETPARQFEYHVLRVGAKARAEGQLNELGSKGWQLVQAVEMDGHLAFYFEREVAALAADQDEPALAPAAEPAALEPAEDEPTDA